MRWETLGVGILLVLAGCASESSYSPSVTQVQPARSMVAEPVGTGEMVWPSTAPNIYARSAIMIDARTGRTLYEKFADTRTQVASTQKLVTALLVVEAGDLDRMVRIAREDTTVEPTKLGVRAGEQYSRGTLLAAMMVKSENDAAAALARDQAGTTSFFVTNMNAKAREVGANDSHFLNPHGLPAPQYSTARDMAKIAFRAYREPVLRRLMVTQVYPFTFNNGRTKMLETTDKLLARSSIFTGMKTGYTDAAGRCLITSASYGGRDVILVQLGSKTSYIFDDAERMVRWGLGGGGSYGTSFLTSN